MVRSGMALHLFKRGWYSTIRKPIKSILLATILCFISLLLLMAVGISGQQDVVQNEMRNQLGGSFRLEMSRYTDDWGIPMEWVDFSEGAAAGQLPLPRPGYEHHMQLSAEEIEKISQVEGISDHNILARGSGSMIDAAYRRFIPLNFENDQTYVGPGRPDPIDDLVNIAGVLSAALLDEVTHGFISLQEGRWIEASDQENADIPLVISAALAEINGLTVGDTMEFEWQDETLSDVLTHFGLERLAPRQISGIIVGIFSVDRSLLSLNAHSLENTIFSRLNVSDAVLGGERVSAGYGLATFHLENVADYPRVRDAILDLDINWDRLHLVGPDDMLMQLGAQFDGLEQISQFLFWGVLIAGFAMLWLIFILWVRNRKHEIAILLAVGTEKRKIVSQFIFEALLLAFVSVALSLALLPLANQFVDVGELNTTFQQQAGDELGLIGGGETAVMAGAAPDTVGWVMGEDFYEIATSSVAVSIEGIAIVLAALTGLIAISIFMAMIPVTRMKPKEIFSKMS